MLPYLELISLSKKRNKTVSDLKKIRKRANELDLMIQSIKSGLDNELMLRKNEDIETAKVFFEALAIEMAKTIKYGQPYFYECYLKKRLTPLTFTTGYDTEKLIELFQLWQPEAYELFRSHRINEPDWQEDINESKKRNGI